jgi:hypothetical protein
MRFLPEKTVAARQHDVRPSFACQRDRLVASSRLAQDNEIWRGADFAMRAGLR